MLQVEAVQARVLLLLRRHRIEFDAVRLCPHHPDARMPSLRTPCLCRKPKPGMLREVLLEVDADPTESWMIGDTDSDVIAGQSAGVRTALILNPDSAHKRAGRVRPDELVQDLGGAVGVVVGGTGRRIHSGR
jgi:D-glycero-D-manno-heptose 1,7-bisphosphate phosphatase